MSGLAQMGKWLANAVKQGILRYGEGPDRMDKILRQNPSLTIDDIPGTAKVPEHTTVTMDTPKGKMSGTLAKYETIHDIPEHDTTPSAYEFAKYGALPNTKFGIAHMLGAEKGGGSTGITYPLFGELAARDKRLILPDFYVTSDNVPNRSLKGASMDLVHGRPVMVPADSQLPDSVTVDRYMGMPQHERAATLFKKAQTTKENELVEQLYNQLWSNTRLSYDKFLKKYNVDPMSGREGLGGLRSDNISDKEMYDIVEYLRRMGIRDVGVDTLRRANVLRHMEENTPAPDGMVKGLLFRQGGLAKASQAMRHVP